MKSTMKQTIILLLSLFLFASCNSQEKRDATQEKKDNIEENKNDKMDIRVCFYPSSGGEAIYSIELRDESLAITNSKPLNDKTPTSYKKHLSREDIQELKEIVKSISKRGDLEADVILDSWRVELIIDGVKYYNESDVNMNTLPADIRKLIEFITKDSSVKIDLYGFS